MEILGRRQLLGQVVAALGLSCIGQSAFAGVPRSHGPVTKSIVPFESKLAPGTIVISNSRRTLHFVINGKTAARYTIGIGKEGFAWTGTTVVGLKREWPTWTPPREMRARDSSLPEMVPPGPYNPLGARAIYLYSKGRDTLYRIHGTNDAQTIGGYVTSGCFRMTNADVLELYEHISIGTKVIVNE